MSIFFEIKSRARTPGKIIPLLDLYIQKLFNINFEKSKGKHLPKIDIVIPTVSKDFGLINDVIASFTKLNHEINKIFIVAPARPEIIEYCTKHTYRFVDEKTVLGYGKDAIDYKVNGVDRSGWIFQQLLKLSCENIVEMDNYFILDSDTIIVDNLSLIENNKFIFYQNEEWHDAYFKTFYKMFGYKTKNKLSFTSHMMIFNKEMLKLMKKELEQKYDISWDKVYLSAIDPHESSCISDYDTYANWILCNFPDKVIQKPLYNIAFNRNKLDEIKNKMNVYSKKYKTISFHSWIK
jgi:hypothetical protein